MALAPQDIIQKKRERQALSEHEIQHFVDGMMQGTWTEGQIAALGMATYFNGMNAEETAWLTQAMACSGDVLDWSSLALSAPVADKHSSGGVGDKVTLLMVPLLAACGVYMPKMSGRALGHTGGTLDKLESIPGYCAAPSLETLQSMVKTLGGAMIGQTSNLAPADKCFYAIRDITATVESIPLITASMLCKKLAAGAQALVLDVKHGNGAFMTSVEDARTLAENLVRVACEAGLPTAALLTDMNQVLGRTAGNALEVLESIACLKGENPEPRLMEVTYALSAELLVLAGVSNTQAEAHAQLQHALTSGQAAERFGQMVAHLGGPADLMENPEKYFPQAPVIHPVYAKTEGVIAAMETRVFGIAVRDLGGGRQQATQSIDTRVGIADMRHIGDAVNAETPLAFVHAADEATAKQVAAQLQAAVTISPAVDAIMPIVSEVIR